MAYFVEGSEALPLPEKTSDFSQLVTGLSNAAAALSTPRVLTLESGSWQGESADAFNLAARALREGTGKVQAALASAKLKLDNYSPNYEELSRSITRLQETWDEELGRYRCQVDAIYDEQREALRLSQLTPDFDYDPSLFASQRSSVENALGTRQDLLIESYRAAVRVVDNAATQLARDLEALLESLVSREVLDSLGGSGVDRTGLGWDLFGENSGAIAGFLHSEDMEEEAGEAIVELRAMIGENGLINIASYEELQEWTDEYGELLSTDPFFAHHFFTHLSAEEVYMLGMGRPTLIVTDEHGLESTTSALHGPADEALNAFQDAFSTGLMIATGGEFEPTYGETSDQEELQARIEQKRLWQNWNVYAEGAEVSQWRADFQTDLITQGGQSFPPNDVDPAPGYAEYERKSGYEVLGSMFARVDEHSPNLFLGDDFLNGVGGDRDSAVGYHLVGWDYETGAEYSGHAGEIFEDGSMGLANTNDPVYNMLTVMNEDSLATAKFFAQDIDFTEESTLGRTLRRGMREVLGLDGKPGMAEYLISGRAISREGFGLPDSDYGPIPYSNYDVWPEGDGGNLIGRLVAYAGVPPEMPEPGAPQSEIDAAQRETEIRGKVGLQYLSGYQNGLDDSMPGPQGRLAFGADNPNLANHSHIALSGYLGDLADAAAKGPANVRGVGNLGIDAQLYTRLINDRNGVFTDLGYARLPNGVPPSQVLESMALLGFEEDVQYAVESKKSLNATVGAWDEVIRNFALAEEDANINSAQHADRKNAEIQAHVSLIVSAVPYGDLVTGGAAGMVAEAIATGASDQAASGLFPTNNTQAAFELRNVEDWKTTAHIQQAYFQGLSLSDFSDWAGDEADELYGELEKLRLLRDGELIPYFGENGMSDKQQKDFENWVINNGYRGEVISNAYEKTNLSTDDANNVNLQDGDKSGEDDK